MALSESQSAVRTGSGLPMVRIHEGLWFAAFLAAYYLAHRYGMNFSQASASPFWFPDSILLCALLRSSERKWWIFVLATLPIRLSSPAAAEVPLWFPLGTFTVDAAKILISAFILRRLFANPIRFQTVREFVFFAIVAVFSMPAISAFAGAGLRNVLGHPYWPAWEQWFLGDALAQLVVTPAILYWVFDPPWRTWKPTILRAIEAAFLVVALVVSGYLAANIGPTSTYFTESRFYAPVPLMLWAALRFGMPGAAGATALVAFFMIDAAMQGHGPFVGQSPGATAFALQNFLLLRAAPLLLLAVSIEQEEAAESALRESEERFRRVAHNTPVLLWMSGRDKLCDFFNQAWLDFTGRSLEQEMGNGWADGIHPDDAAECVRQYHAAFDGREPFEIEYRLRRRDGEYRWVLDKGVPRYGSGGDFAGYIGSAIDITDRKRSEETTRALAHSQRLAVMGELTAAIAHELRQPMSVILLDAHTMEKLAESNALPLDALREIALSLRENVTRVEGVIGRIRRFLRRQNTQMQPLDVNTAVLDVLRLVSGDASRRNVRLRTALDRNLPSVMGDRMQLEQVLLNLVVNGLDAIETAPGKPRHLTLHTARGEDGSAEIVVSDSGPGIAPEQMDQLFDSFFTTRQEGMGLGLWISKSIIEAHQGRIWAENNADGGASFHFTVPVAKE